MKLFLLGVLVASGLTSALCYRHLAPILARGMCPRHGRLVRGAIAGAGFLAIALLALRVPLRDDATSLALALASLAASAGACAYAWTRPPPGVRDGVGVFATRVGGPAVACLAAILALAVAANPAVWGWP